MKIIKHLAVQLHWTSKKSIVKDLSPIIDIFQDINVMRISNRTRHNPESLTQSFEKEKKRQGKR